ncbi:MAG: beta-L-arabinofuranosidase domain-containing protein [Eubacteriales bacterium]
MTDYRIHNKVDFSPISATHFGGAIDAYMMRFFERRVLSDFAKTTVFDEAEEALRNPRDDDTIVGMWSGEFWGKLVISACRVYEYTHNEDLLGFLNQTVHRVLSYARADGYINSYKDSANVLPPDPDKTVPLMGWRCDWNWNIWCRKYTLWGLVEYAALTGDRDALTGAHRLAVQLIDELNEKGIRLGDTGTANFSGVPSSSILKPMLLLYRMTDDTKLLDFCISIAEDWDREDGKRPNLIRNALSGKPIHEWYPKSHLWAKAYETMSCLDGLLELYRVTGTEKYFAAVKSMYELLSAHESNVMGGVGFNDIFANASAWENAITEPCDVIHWMRVCSELFALTGEAKYMDSVERAFYNAFLASVSDDGEWGARGVRSSGRHYRAEGQSGCNHNHCCVDNLPRGYLNVTSSTVMSGTDGFYINQYCPFECVLPSNAGSVCCADGYLETGRTLLTVNAAAPLTLFLRIPSISGKNATITVGERRQAVVAGGFAKLEVGAGVTEIALGFAFSAVVHEFAGTVESYPTTDFRTDRWIWENEKEDFMPLDSMMDKPCAHITYGPLILAHSKKVGSTEAEMFGFCSIHGRGFAASAMPSACTDSDVLCRFTVRLTNGTETVETEMCDFASASDIMDNRDTKFFNLYL